MKKIKILTFSLFNILAIILLIGSTYFSYLLINALNQDKINIGQRNSKVVSKIYDDVGNEVRSLGVEDAPQAQMIDVPDSFIYALISIEDRRFFIHDGVDVKRLIGSAINNIKEMRFAEGASTLTQQLIKNEILNNDKKIERKVNEIVLAYNLERVKTKEEIFLLYINNIYFDGVKPGVNEAAKRFFSKTISEVTIPEAALLAALVKSPTLYNPLKNPANAEARKNLVIDLMCQYQYITPFTAAAAKKITVADMLNPFYNQITYDYQSYFDLVYQEVADLTGLDPYNTAMEIKTYMNLNLQKRIDLIQSGADPVITFNDQLLQIGGVVLDNEQKAIIGVIGGRNYQGEKIFNRAFDLVKQPASTIKPLLSYALAFEHLNWTNEHVVVDQPYFYPNGQEVHNADNTFMGELTLEQALGYSRNTSALYTLEEVIKKIGVNKVSEYLQAIDMLDVDGSQFNIAYGLGAYIHGVSPLQLAQAYQMLANLGTYKKATTIKEIKIIESGEKIIPNYIENHILSEEATYKMDAVLQGVISKNYWGIGAIKSAKTLIHGKTGTSSFDKNQLQNLNYPSNAAKDIWVAGFSGDYTIAVWSGFDKYIADSNTYFGSSDNRKSIPRNIFKELIELLPAKKEIKTPSTLIKRRILKGYYPYTIADETISEQFVTYSYFNKDEVLNNQLPIPSDLILQEPLVSLQDNLLIVDFIPLPTNPIKTVFSLENIYGQLGYIVEITDPNEETYVIKSSELTITSYLFASGFYQIKICAGYFDSQYRSNEYNYDIFL